MSDQQRDGVEQVQQLSLTTIQRVDYGKVATAFDMALKQVVADVIDRPMDDKARTVALTVKVTPELDVDAPGDLENIGVQFFISAKVPQRQSKNYPMNFTNNGVLTFQPGSPMDPDQSAFDFEPPEQSE